MTDPRHHQTPAQGDIHYADGWGPPPPDPALLDDIGLPAGWTERVLVIVGLAVIAWLPWLLVGWLVASALA